MKNPEIIDAEFSVVSSGREIVAYQEPEEQLRPVVKLTTWTFWEDDMPNLLGILASVGLAFLGRIWFHL